MGTGSGMSPEYYRGDLKQLFSFKDILFNPLSLVYVQSSSLSKYSDWIKLLFQIDECIDLIEGFYCMV